MKKNNFYLIASFFIFSLFPSGVFAHSSGYSHEVLVDGYQVDIGYNLEAPIAGDRMRFDFEITPVDLSASSTDLFTDVWVSIKNGEEIYFSGDVHKPVFGPTGINLVVADPGEYTVFTRFQKDGEKVVESGFSLNVTSTTSEKSIWKYISLALLIVLIILGFILWKQQSLKK